MNQVANLRLRLALAALTIPILSAGAVDIEEVQVTATRSAGSVSAVPEAVTVVGSEAFEDGQLQLVTDALRGQAGVFVQQTTPGQGTAIVRGLKGSEVLHLVDGMRLNNALFRNAPNQYLALVDPLSTERIEVVRGPLSTLYGSDAMGGVLQVITDRPFLGGGPWQLSGRALARYDSRTLGEVAHASIAAGHGALGFGGSVSYQDHDDLRAADRRAQVPTAYRSRSANAFVSYRPDDGTRNDLSIQFLEQPSTPRYDELVPGFGQSEAASDVFFFEPNSRFFVHAQHESGGWAPWLDEFEAHLSFQRMTDDRRTRDFGDTRERVEQNHSDMIGLTLRGATEPGRVHTFNYGLDTYYDEVSSARQQVDITTGEQTDVSSRFPDGSTLSTVDLYVQDVMTLSPTLTLTAGARISHATVELTGDAERPAADVSNTDVTASLGLHFDLTDEWTLLANLGRGFRAPNIFDLGTLGVRPGNRFNIANPNLEPETVWTVDTGLRLDTETLSVEMFVWYSDYQDQITSVSTGEVDAAGREIVQSQNANSVLLRGAEFSARYKLSPRWSTELALNTVWGETEISAGDEEPADRIPPLDGRVGLRYERARWWIDGNVRFAGRQDRLSSRDVRDPRINPLGTPGFALWEIRAGVQWNDNVKSTLGVYNLADKSYREHGSGVDGAGRSLALTLEAAF